MLGRRQFVGAIGAAGVAAPFVAPSVARAQAWPPSRVTVVVPFPAGAATDIGARVYAEQLSALWGQPVVVDNKGGGNGIPAAESVARAKPDGLTIFATSAMTPDGQPGDLRQAAVRPGRELRGDHAARHLAVRAAGRPQQPD